MENLFQPSLPQVNSAVGGSEGGAQPLGPQTEELRQGVCRRNHSLVLCLTSSAVEIYCDECGRRCGLSRGLAERTGQTSSQSTERRQVSLHCSQCNYDVCLHCAECLGFWVLGQNGRCMKGHSLVATTDPSQQMPCAPSAPRGGACFLCNGAEDLRWCCSGPSSGPPHSPVRCDFFLCYSCSIQLRVAAPGGKAPTPCGEEIRWSRSVNPNEPLSRSVAPDVASYNTVQPQPVTLRCPRGHWLNECPVVEPLATASRGLAAARDDRMCDDCGLVIPLRFADTTPLNKGSPGSTLDAPRLPLPNYFYQCWPCDFDLCEKCASNRLRTSEVGPRYPGSWPGTQTPYPSSLLYGDRNLQLPGVAPMNGPFVHPPIAPTTTPVFPQPTSTASPSPPTFILNWNGLGVGASGGSSPYPTEWPQGVHAPQMSLPPSSQTPQPSGYCPQYI